MHFGIRQGCPPSPLLLVTDVDSFLRHLASSLPTATPRAYADNTALVVEESARDLPVARNIFDSFALISGFRFHFAKNGHQSSRGCLSWFRS